jgi:hypothetical protein
MSDKLDKIKFIYTTLNIEERKTFIEFSVQFEKDSFEKNQAERQVLESKAYSLGPVSVVNSSGRCVLCGK